MMKVLLSLVLSFSAMAPTGAGCLRIMAPTELASRSSIIARARVVDVDESEFGPFRQIATLELVDVIEGDFTVKTVRVGARSMVACAEDRYRKKEEWLVFLEQDAALYHTVNYQYGQFRIEGDVIRDWRDAEAKAVDASYYSVRLEIEAIIAGLRTPAAETAPEQVAPPPPSPPNAQQVRRPGRASAQRRTTP